jgi:hypothetical protein
MKKITSTSRRNLLSPIPVDLDSHEREQQNSDENPEEAFQSRDIYHRHVNATDKIGRKFATKSARSRYISSWAGRLIGLGVVPGRLGQMFSCRTKP